MEKDKSIIEIVRWLKWNLDERLVVVDHWEGDLCAVGLASSENLRRIVYISTWATRGKFHVELEAEPSPGSELPYTAVGEPKKVERSELLSIVRSHLHLA